MRKTAPIWGGLFFAQYSEFKEFREIREFREAPSHISRKVR